MMSGSSAAISGSLIQSPQNIPSNPSIQNVTYHHRKAQSSFVGPRQENSSPGGAGASGASAEG